jgi:hypothetical protein
LSDVEGSGFPATLGEGAGRGDRIVECLEKAVGIRPECLRPAVARQGTALEEVCAFVHLTEHNGVPVTICRTRRPGTVIYSDEYQIAEFPARYVRRACPLPGRFPRIAVEILLVVVGLVGARAAGVWSELRLALAVDRRAIEGQTLAHAIDEGKRGIREPVN